MKLLIMNIKYLLLILKFLIIKMKECLQQKIFEKKELTATTIKKYIFCYNKKEKEKENLYI